MTDEHASSSSHVDEQRALGPHEHSDNVEQIWQNVLATWSDEQVHRRFIAFCQATGQLSEAAKRYRQILPTDPLRHADAQAHLRAITALALAAMTANRKEPSTRRHHTLTLISIGIFLGMVGWAMWAFRGTLQ